MATTSTRKAAPHAKTCKEVDAIAHASESVHALLCVAIAHATQREDRTMIRVLELALCQIDDIDVDLAAFQEEV